MLSSLITLCQPTVLKKWYREKEVEGTKMDLLKPCTEGLEVRDASSSAPHDGVTLSMKLSKKNILQRSFPRWSPMRGERCSDAGLVHSSSERSHLWSLYEKKNTPGVEWSLRSACVGLYSSTNFGGRSQNSERGEWVEKRHKNAQVVQDDLANWIHCDPMNTKETSETFSCLLWFLPPSQSVREFTQTSPKSLSHLVKICNGIMTQAHFIAQKRKEWQRMPSAEWKKEQLS